MSLFKIQALTIRLAIENAQKSLIKRALIKKPKIIISDDYLVDLEKMYKKMYSLNLQNKLRGTSLEDAIGDITHNIFLSDRKVHQRKSRSSYVLPDGIKLNRVETLVMGYDTSKSLFNYLAQTVAREMIDFKKDSYKNYSKRISLTSEDGDSLEDEAFIDYNPETTLIDNIVIDESIEALANEVAENLNMELFSKDFLVLTLRLFMYSFQVAEIAKILDVHKDIIQEIKSQLKDALFNLACDENKETLIDLESLDTYLKDVGGRALEFKKGRKTLDEIEETPISDLNQQLKEVLGRDYFVVAEVREYLNKQGF